MQVLVILKDGWEWVDHVERFDVTDPDTNTVTITFEDGTTRTLRGAVVVAGPWVEDDKK